MIDLTTITLTVDLRRAIEETLEEAIEQGLRGGHCDYLHELNATPDGAPLGRLADVVEYFNLEYGLGLIEDEEGKDR